MAYESIHTGVQIDAAVSQMADVENVRQEVAQNKADAVDAANAAALDKTAAQTAANEAELSKLDAAESEGLAELKANEAAGSANAARLAQAGAESARDLAQTYRDQAKEYRDSAAGIAAGNVFKDDEVSDKLGWSSQKVSTDLAAKVSSVDLADDTDPDAGAKIVGYDGITVQDVLDEIRPEDTYDGIRSYAGRAKGIRLTTLGIAGDFRRDDSDVTSPDDGGVCIVDASGRRWKRDYEGLADVRWWSPLTGIDAINAALAATRNIRLERGATYTLNAPITSIGQDITIDGNGAKLIATTTAGQINIYGGYDNDQAVTSVNSTYIGVGDASVYSIGDVAKIYSEALSPYGRFMDDASAEYARCGEFFVVDKVDAVNNRLYFLGSMAHDYQVADSARVCRIIPRKIRISNFELEHAEGIVSPERFMKLEALAYAQISNVRTARGYTRNIWLQSCFGCHLDRIQCDFLSDEGYEGYVGNTGYGVWLQNSESNVISGSVFKHVRHATDGSGTYNPSANFPQSRYGITRGNVITGSSGIGCSNTTFGWHHGSVSNAVIGCHSFRSGTAGFGSRGVNNSFKSCVSDSDRDGLWAFRQDSAVTDAIFDDCTVINPSSRAVRVGEGCTAYIHNLSVVINRGADIFAMFDLLNGSTSRFKGLGITVDAPVTNLPGLFNIDTTSTDVSTLEVKRLNLVVTESGSLPNENWVLVRCGSSPSQKLDLDDIDLVFHAGSRIRFLTNGSIDSDSRIGRVYLAMPTMFTALMNGVTNEDAITTGPVIGPVVSGKVRKLERVYS